MSFSNVFEILVDFFVYLAFALLVASLIEDIILWRYFRKPDISSRQFFRHDKFLRPELYVTRARVLHYYYMWTVLLTFVCVLLALGFKFLGDRFFQ